MDHRQWLFPVDVGRNAPLAFFRAGTETTEGHGPGRPLVVSPRPYGVAEGPLPLCGASRRSSPGRVAPVPARFRYRKEQDVWN